MQNIRIGDRLIGDGNPCFIVAEAGSNHNGKLELAKQLIDAAASSNADAVKFQLFRANRMYPQSAGVSEYLKIAEPIYDVVSKLEMPYDWIPALAAYCKEKKVLFFASVFDEESVDQLDPHVQAFKIASYELTHLPLIRYVASKNKPIILSTGAASLTEVAATVEEVRRSNTRLILMQCTAAYPAPLETLNVRVIPSMKSIFGVPVGLSDHSRDPFIGPLAAVSLGANMIEKHLTMDNDLPGPDHRFALEPEEFRSMVQRIRYVEKALGTGQKVTQPIEEELRAFARRSIFVIRDIEVGEVLTRGNIAILRRGKLSHGLEPVEFEAVLGKRAKRRLQLNTPLQRDDYG